MTVTLDIPDEIGLHLAANPEALTQTALEALAIEGSRSGRLTTEQVRRLLRFSTRYEADGFLKQHHVYPHLTTEGVERDAAVAWRFSQGS